MDLKQKSSILLIAILSLGLAACSSEKPNHGSAGIEQWVEVANRDMKKDIEPPITPDPPKVETKPAPPPEIETLPPLPTKEEKPKKPVKSKTLSNLDPNIFDDMINVIAREGWDSESVEEGDSVIVRLENERYEFVSSMTVPVICFTDHKNEVSFQLIVETEMLIKLAPTINCNYDFNDSHTMKVLENQNPPTIQLPELSNDLRPLFETFSNRFIEEIRASMM